MLERITSILLGITLFVIARGLFTYSLCIPNLGKRKKSIIILFGLVAIAVIVVVGCKHVIQYF